jgi:hypothetical protein
MTIIGNILKFYCSSWFQMQLPQATRLG